jgi:hypothetical protein
LLSQGAVLVDDADDGLEPRLLVYLEHAVRDGRVARSGEPRVVSQRLQFVHMKADGSAAEAGSAPYLDCRPITPEERATIDEAIDAPWLSSGVEERALGHAIANLVPSHLAEVRRLRLPELDKVEREVRARLTREVNYWDARAARLREEERAGMEQRINASNAEATAQRLVERLHARQEELARERQIMALPPVLRGAALVIPMGLLRSRMVEQPEAGTSTFSSDPAARRVVELAAMEAVMAHERALGHAPVDVSAQKKGWDVESRDRTTGHLRLIEVKGRHADARDVILTKNELLAALNAPEAFYLALVKVSDGQAQPPVYVQRFVQREPGFAETAVVFSISDLLVMGGEASPLPLGDAIA